MKFKIWSSNRVSLRINKSLGQFVHVRMFVLENHWKYIYTCIRHTIFTQDLTFFLDVLTIGKFSVKYIYVFFVFLINKDVIS